VKTGGIPVLMSISMREEGFVYVLSEADGKIISLLSAEIKPFPVY